MSNDFHPKVPIPEGAVVYSDRVCFVFGQIFSEKQNRNILNRKQIGTPCKDEPGMMFPNNQYMKSFPHEFEQYTGMSSLVDRLSIGLFAAVSTIIDDIGLRSCLESVFGVKRTNSILDYAMYLMSYHSNASEHFEYRMEEQLLFSERTYSDSFWSAFFSKLKLKEIKQFKTIWAKKCAERKINMGYASWDGSNDDCDSKKTEYAHSGKAKSGTSGKIFGFMYCVAEDGTPITYDVYDGSEPDSNEIKNMISFLKPLGIGIEGAIIDRGFDSQECLDQLLLLVDDYVVKLKERTEGFKYAAKEKGDDIRSLNRKLRIPHKRIIGTTVNSKFFSNSRQKEWVHIYYDFENGGERAFTLLDEVDGAIDDIKKYVAAYSEYEAKWEEEHKEKKDSKKKSKKDDVKKAFSPSVPAKVSQYIKIKGNTPQTFEIEVDDKKLDADLGIKGIYAIGTHKEMSAEKALCYYQLRDHIEKVFDTIKTMLGFRRVRTETTDSLESRMLVAFVATIIVAELERASKEIAKEKHSSNPKFDTCMTIDHLLAVHMSLLSNSTYGLQRKSLAKVRDVYKKLNAPDDVLEKTVEAANARFQKKRKKERERQKQKTSKSSHTKQKSTADQTTDTNENTSTNQNTNAQDPEPKKAKRPRGRPRKMKDPNEEAKPKRPRGRPRKATDPNEENRPKRPRGRPRKVRNPDEETKEKRPRGRPRKEATV